MKHLKVYAVLLLLPGTITSTQAQSNSKKEKIIEESKEAKAAFIKADSKMSDLFAKSSRQSNFHLEIFDPCSIIYSRNSMKKTSAN